MFRTGIIELFVVGPGTFNSFLILFECIVRNPLGSHFFGLEKEEARKEGVGKNSGGMKSHTEQRHGVRGS